METQTVRTVRFLAQYAQIRNLLIKQFNNNKTMFKKHRISCHNLFLLGKTGPTRYLTLQENHNVSISGLFYFGSVGQLWKSAPSKPTLPTSIPHSPTPNPPPHPKSKISSLFLPKFNWQYGISKMVSLRIRRLKESNLCGFFDFGVMSPNMESKPQFTPRG